MQLSRYAMYRDIAGALGAPLGGRILGVSGVDRFRHLIEPGADVEETTYPEVDLQDLPFPDGSFDAVISDQVLEHLADPRRAVHEGYRVLRPGGVAVHTTCFLNPLHLSPRDYYRFSPDGLRALCPSGSEVIRCHAWGNRIALVMTLVRDRARFIQIPDRPGVRRWLATRNETKFPIVSWIVMKKPLTTPGASA